MADIVSLDVRNTTSTQITASAGAASFTVQLGAYGDSRAVLAVTNGDSDTIRVNVKAGDGMRSVLGDLDVDIAAGKTGAIPLGDSMRFKTATTNEVTVNLNDTSDTSLTATPLGNITCVLIEG